MTEAALGLKFEQRHGQDYYLSQLREEHKAIIKKIEEKSSLIELLNEWLERMPYLDLDDYWKDYHSGSGTTFGGHVFWGDYRTAFENSLVEGEKENLKIFDRLFFDEDFTNDRRLSAKANRSALFIMLYRDYPLLQMPYKLFNSLLEIDELMATWRYRHMNMVHRMIGKRVGTGGSSGKDYLKASMDKHYIFSEIAELTSFLIERRNLPNLSTELESKLGFVH
jgi:tryptophan 2,3-dioxygenase